MASHNLHHVALALQLAADRGASAQVDVEMLQGMAPAWARTVAADAPDRLVLYTPVVHRGDFDAAVSYLVRRLEENAAPENYLYALFSEAGPSAYLARFRDSVRDRDAVRAAPSREQDRGHAAPPVPAGRVPQRAGHRPVAAGQPGVGRRAATAPAPAAARPEVTDPAAVDGVVRRARDCRWGAPRPPSAPGCCARRPARWPRPAASCSP